MDIPTIRAWARDERGTRASRRLRKRRLVPAVLYGRGEPNVLLSVEEDAITRLVAQHAMILQVEWDGHQASTQLKAVQLDSLGDSILHVDFNRISLTEMVRVTVPIEAHGEPPGVKEQGGVLEMIVHEIEVECLPTSIPEKIRVDVTGVHVGEDVRVGALQLPEGIKALGDPDVVVLLVAMPTEIVEKEEAAPAEAVAAEPEVIGKKEEPREEEEEAPEQKEAAKEKQ